MSTVHQSRNRLFSPALWLTVAVFTFSATASHAANVLGTGTVTKVTSYATFGDGDVLFGIYPALSVCPHGFWIRASDSGSTRLLSTILAAKATASSIEVNAVDDSLWPGTSTGTFCRVTSAAIL